MRTELLKQITNLIDSGDSRMDQEFDQFAPSRTTIRQHLFFHAIHAFDLSDEELEWCVSSSCNVHDAEFWLQAKEGLKDELFD